MNPELWSLVVNTVGKLRDCGSWCGETHVQKTIYFFVELTGKHRKELDFVLYKHGPFSFELRDELNGLMGCGLLKFEVQQPPYGPKLKVTRKADRAALPELAAKDSNLLDLVCSRVGTMDVATLERVATALLVSKQRLPGVTDERRRAEMLRELKPHVSEEDSLQATRFVDSFVEEVSGVKPLVAC